MPQPSEKPLELVDIGVNLANKSFRGDLEQVIGRAQRAGVRRMVVTGTDVHASRQALELARRGDGLFATAGVHPHHARDCDAGTLGALRALAGERQVVAIGECGLDYNRNFSPPADQRHWFERQVELAIELKMPLFLHERDAHADFVAIMRAHRPALRAGVVHCFTGSQAELEAYLELDLHIGITGWICDDRRGVHLRQLVGLIPAERLMLETDAPYLLPRDMHPLPKDRRNEPAFLSHVLRRVAACRGEAPEETARRSTETAIRFFGLDEA